MLTATQILQLFALATGIICFKYIKPVFLRWIVPILFITCVNEIVMIRYIIPDHFPGKENLAYNIFSLPDMIVWLFIYFKSFKQRKWKKIIFSFGIILILVSLLDLYLNGWELFHIDSIILYEFFLIFLSIRYLYEIFTKEYHDLFTDIFFWIASACLLYHSILIINFTTMKVADYWKMQNAAAIFNILQMTANIFYYLLISFSFILCFYYNQKYKKVTFPLL